MVYLEKKQEESVKDLKKIIKELEEKIKEKDLILKNITKSIPEIRFWKLFNPKKYEEALRTSYDVLQMVMDDIPENIFWKDTNFIYLGCNKSYAMLIGADDPQDVIGKTDIELLMDKEKCDYLQEHETNIMNSDNAEYHIIEEWVLKDGTKILLDTNRIPLHDSTGKSVGILVTYSDITERKKAELIIKEEVKKLKELDQLRRDLITRVSHELKTPLISVYSGSELLLDYYNHQISDNVLEIIEMIHRGGKKLKNLIDNLLDISKIESDKLKLDKLKENLPEILKECINDMIFLAKNRNLSIEIDLPKELLLEIDKIRINQVFINILSNAIKNTPSNGKIYVSLEETENYIDVIIKDTGVGLIEKEMELIFKKFGKIERYGKQMDVEIGGTGLGLYLSKEIMELHEGKILVESEGRNKGCTFTIRFFKKFI